MKAELLLNQGVRLAPILMHQDQLIQTKREHLRLKVNNLNAVLQIQVPVEGQDVHLIVQLVLMTHQGTCNLFQVVDPWLDADPEPLQVLHPIRQH
jgi:hypothetical protein